MKNIQIKQIIIGLLQSTLIGKLKEDSSFNPQQVADAIVAKIDFEKPYNEIKNDKFIYDIKELIIKHKNDNNQELKKLKPEEKLLGNFIHGKLTICDEILDEVNSLK